jgi:hypothetical protein
LIANNPKTFRFASTAPFYVDVGEGMRRVSKASARFFREWVRERVERIKLDYIRQRDDVLKYHTAAQRFWPGLEDHAKAE